MAGEIEAAPAVPPKNYHYPGEGGAYRMGSSWNTDMEFLLLAAGGARRKGAAAEPEAEIQEAVVAVGRRPVWAVRRPARACPRDKETPWLRGGRALPPHQEGGTDPARLREHRAVVPGGLPTAMGGGGGCPGQGVQSLLARRGGTCFTGQQLTSQRLAVAFSTASTPSRPKPGPGSLLPSPGLEPSWALGARVTVSGLAGPRPGLCQLAIAAATSHYLAWPARKGY